MMREIIGRRATRRAQWAGVLVALASGAARGETLPDRDVEWLKPPQRQQILAVVPLEAHRLGKGGRARLECQVSVQGALYDCRVASETPEGLGFGRAAVSLTPHLLMKPAIRNGSPVVSGVSFDVNFPTPEIETGSHIPGARARLDLKPDMVRSVVAWEAAPTYGDVVAAYPAKARAKGVGGRSSVECRFAPDGALTACRSYAEEPRGLGFRQAAVELARGFRAPQTDPSGRRLAGDYTTLSFVFAPEMLQDGRQVIGKPLWTALPSSEDFKVHYPKAASDAGVGQASILMQCRIGPSGALEGCQVERETPGGLGFGEAALALAPRFRTALWTSEGLPVVGGAIKIPLRYDVTLAGPSPAGP